MSETNLPTRLRAILSRTPKKNATDEQVDQFFGDLNAIIHDIEQIEIDMAQERIRDGAGRVDDVERRGCSVHRGGGDRQWFWQWR